MSDYERYGDYNETEEDGAQSTGILLRILKFLVVLLLVAVCALIAFRLIVAAYYPKAMKSLYMTDALLEYAEHNELRMEERHIEVPFDDSSEASFKADNLLADETAGSVQLSLRMNDATMEFLAERMSLSEIPAYSESLFAFRLTDNLGRQYEPTYVAHDSYLWYHAVKLCFDGVAFEEGLAWIRVDVYETVSGEPDFSAEPYASVPLFIWVYEVVD